MPFVAFVAAAERASFYIIIRYTTRQPGTERFAVGEAFGPHRVMINLDGTGLEQITFDEQFDSFPMFSYDGKKLIFSSNRYNGGTRNTNLFIADWVE